MVENRIIFIRNGEKIAENSNELLQAKTLYNNYYNNASPLNAQFVTVTDRGKDRICKDDTNKLINNNIDATAQRAKKRLFALVCICFYYS